MQRAFHTVSAARKHLHQAPLLETFSYREKTYSYAGSTKKMFQDVIIRNEFVTHQNDLTVKAWICVIYVKLLIFFI